MSTPNPWLLAADGSPNLLPLLRSRPELASKQDAHGYSLVHALASYGHRDILKTLIEEFNVNVDILDEDGESALFSVEDVETTRFLLETLHANLELRNTEGQTAMEKIQDDGDFPLVVAYLAEITALRNGLNGDFGVLPTVGMLQSNGTDGSTYGEANELRHPPPLPPNVTVNLGTMEEPAESSQNGEGVVDPELRRRIEELAQNPNFQNKEGQEELRRLVEEVVRGGMLTDSEGARDVRQRTE
jgi:uncharacterized protein